MTDAIDLSPDELVVDLFAGGGGASSGIEEAIGRPVDVAVNHDEHAIEMHTANHPSTRHLCESVFDVDPLEVVGRRPVGFLWASPDCFPAGTMVLTTVGYRAIEEVTVGDRVLTHQGRWRAVTSTMSSVKATRTIRGHGHPGLRVSREHPFWTSTRTTKRTYRPSKMTHAWSPPTWTAAADLRAGEHYWSRRCPFPRSAAAGSRSTSACGGWPVAMSPTAGPVSRRRAPRS